MNSGKRVRCVAIGMEFKMAFVLIKVEIKLSNLNLIVLHYYDKNFSLRNKKIKQLKGGVENGMPRMSSTACNIALYPG